MKFTGLLLGFQWLIMLNFVVAILNLEEFMMHSLHIDMQLIKLKQMLILGAQLGKKSSN